MSASMMRNFYKVGRKVIHAHRHSVLLQHTRCINGREIIDKKAPYFPKEDEKRSLDAEYPEVEILHNEFKFVERLIPSKTVPEPPENEVYPTPSGWVPPDKSLQPAEYAVGRTRNHMLPCYFRKHFSGRETIKVTQIYGDIWKLKEDATKFFEEHGKSCEIQVHEIGRFVRFRGNCHDLVAKFLLSKGF